MSKQPEKKVSSCIILASGILYSHSPPPTLDPPLHGEGGQMVFLMKGGQYLIMNIKYEVNSIISFFFLGQSSESSSVPPPSDAPGEPFYNWTWAKKNFFRLYTTSGIQKYKKIYLPLFSVLTQKYFKISSYLAHSICTHPLNASDLYTSEI